MAEAKKLDGNGKAAKPNGEDRRIPKKGAFKLQDAVNNRWRVVLPAEATAEDLADPALYVFAPQGTQAYDVVWATGKDFAAEVMCRDYLIGAFQPVVLRVIQLPPQQDDTGERWRKLFDISHDHVEGWVARRKSDNHLLGTSRSKGWKSKEDAIRHCLDHATSRIVAR